jgi:N-formylglutamate amidohydrolase
MRWLDDGSQWLQFSPGDVPLVLTFAHAGSDFVDEIDGARRDPGAGFGCAFNDSRVDTHTRVIAEAILAYMDWQGRRPYVVIPRVSRRDVDLNRSWAHNEAGYTLGGVSAAGVDLARTIHDEFFAKAQEYVDDIRGRFTADADRALLIDIHGAGFAPPPDLEIGTRNRTSADAGLVFVGPPGGSSVMQSLIDAGFTIRSDAGTSEALTGCHVLANFGRAAGGVHAIQFELSPVARGTDRPAGEQEAVARATGVRIARALGGFLLANAYPVIAPPTSATDDQEHYITLFA